MTSILIHNPDYFPRILILEAEALCSARCMFFLVLHVEEVLMFLNLQNFIPDFVAVDMLFGILSC